MNTTTELTNALDMIDTRDMIEAIEAGEAGESLIAFARECEDHLPDYLYGETLIRDSYFEEYAKELADDIGAIPDDLGWPLTCIDWGQAARELQYDYTALEWDGVTYWGRS